MQHKKPSQTEQLIASIIDAQESDIIIVRRKGCQTIFANETAEKRVKELELPDDPDQDCRNSFAKVFPELCTYCNKKENAKVDIKDSFGHLFSLTSKEILWLDEQPAVIFIIKNVEEERMATQTLYNLAFIDYLTQIPNRRKLREDFKALEPDITDGNKSGVISIFDLDNFKAVNDTYGHNTGDMMLQRLTEHLQSDPVYAGHLYRLGGDEFAFLYSDDTGAHPDLYGYYEQLLRGALNSYSMPNIDVSCTISLGFACFPEHGEDLSTLLRKADIALYKAKEGGRNKLEKFESKDDIFQDFKDLYINIKPILDACGNTFGYELTDGSADADNKNATINLIDFNRTLDILGLDEIYSSKLYFINYSKNMLAAAKQNQLKNKFIIQINVTSHGIEEDIADYIKLKELGFSISVNCSNLVYLSEELIAVADYIKFVPYQNMVDNIKNLIVANKNLTLIADSINNSQQLVFANKVGCRLFQGHYFKEAKKVTEKIKNIEPLHSNYFQLLKLTCTGEYVDFEEISKIIASDVAMSYRLLKMINTVALRTKNKISTISMAVTYLGEARLKQWIALMSLRGITPDKPLELIRMSLIRAKFGELLAPHFKEYHNPDQIFMLGMLSLLHVALDISQEELLNEISLVEELRDSFLTKTGKYSKLVVFFKNYEHSEWEEVAKFAKENGLNNKTINDAYLLATKWYNDLVNEE